MREEKSCFTCKHAIYHAKVYSTWVDPGEEEWAECDAVDMPEEIEERCSAAEWDEYKCPEICGMYERASEEELEARFG